MESILNLLKNDPLQYSSYMFSDVFVCSYVLANDLDHLFFFNFVSDKYDRPITLPHKYNQKGINIVGTDLPLLSLPSLFF